MSMMNDVSLGLIVQYVLNTILIRICLVLVCNIIRRISSSYFGNNHSYCCLLMDFLATFNLDLFF